MYSGKGREKVVVVVVLVMVMVVVVAAAKPWQRNRVVTIDENLLPTKSDVSATN